MELIRELFRTSQLDTQGSLISNPTRSPAVRLLPTLRCSKRHKYTQISNKCSNEMSGFSAVPSGILNRLRVRLCGFILSVFSGSVPHFSYPDPSAGVGVWGNCSWMSSLVSEIVIFLSIEHILKCLHLRSWYEACWGFAISRIQRERRSNT